MIVNFEDQEWPLDLDAVDVNQARYIKRNAGLTLLQLEEGMEAVDVDAFVALYWLMKNQAGVAVDMHKVNFPIVKFGRALKDAFEAEKERRAQNPTSADSPEPESAT